MTKDISDSVIRWEYWERGCFNGHIEGWSVFVGDEELCGCDSKEAAELVYRGLIALKGYQSDYAGH